eukprot:3428639-Pyramimonas_sp.AAC.1
MAGPQDHGGALAQGSPRPKRRHPREQRVMGKMWEGALAVLKRHSKWTQEFELGTNGPRGLLF